MKEGTYTARAIRVLSSVDAIRRHPAMFIGGTGSAGLHHLAAELIDNAVDEALAGFCHRFEVRVHGDGSLSVVDDGRGIPVDSHGPTGRPGAELVMTRLHAGAKFGGGAYAVSGGVHGVGLSCVCALSERVELEVWRSGHSYRQDYARGVPLDELTEQGTSERTGTGIRFWPDSEVFSEVEWSAKLLARRLAELSCLVEGVSIAFVDERDDAQLEWGRAADLPRLVGALAGPERALHDPVVFSTEQEGTRAEVALLWTDGRRGEVRAFTNAVFNESGGTHARGLLEGLGAALREVGADAPPVVDVTAGLFAVVSVWMAQPQFASQTKTRLASAQARVVVRTGVSEGLVQALQGDAALREVVSSRVARAAAERAAGTAARKASQARARSLGVLHGVLADCEHEHPEDTELFLVEGPSAGGSAKQARDRHFQAVLPLRGKVLNAERATVDQILHNRELSAIVDALGCGIGPSCDPDLCRYGRVVIMTDADPDGSHIRALLLTFFFRDLLPLVQAGRIFVAQPPLYRVKDGRNVHYLLDEAALEAFKDTHPRASVQRFKGLGEMAPEQLRVSTMDPETRTLLQVGVSDPVRADAVFHQLMGEDVAERRAFIEEAWDATKLG